METPLTKLSHAERMAHTRAFLKDHIKVFFTLDKLCSEATKKIVADAVRADLLGVFEDIERLPVEQQVGELRILLQRSVVPGICNTHDFRDAGLEFWIERHFGMLHGM
jgi:hypothetical protein